MYTLKNYNLLHAVLFAFVFSDFFARKMFLDAPKNKRAKVSAANIFSTSFSFPSSPQPKRRNNLLIEKINREPFFPLWDRICFNNFTRSPVGTSAEIALINFPLFLFWDDFAS
jgi:hypothetical protein